MKTFPQAVSAAALLATAVISLMPPAIAQGLAPVSVLPVQGNVYMFYSRSGNVAAASETRERWWSTLGRRVGKRCDRRNPQADEEADPLRDRYQHQPRGDERADRSGGCGDGRHFGRRCVRQRSDHH
ncbi:MAG: hypothetical protein WDO18_15670 [Acidobacteriota bacterium]